MPKVARTALLAGLLAGLGLVSGVGACFIESAQPSTFRYQCSASDECEDNQICSDGLCQQPCGAEMEACSNGTVCINGFCSSVCPTSEDVCPAPQECVALSSGEDEDEGEGEEAQTGVCTILCDEEHPCTEGQICLLGFCASECQTAEDCGSGEECLPVSADVQACVPSGSGGGGFP